MCFLQMRKIGFRQRNSYGYDGSILEGDDITDSDSNQDRRSRVTRPQAHGTLSADFVSQRPSLLGLQSRLGRVGRHESFANSIFPGADGQISTSSGDYSPDLLGLQLICDNVEPSGDIVFVHGLGGTAMRTWSWKRDVNNFWPVWLADEQELSSFRVFSFGYNSNFKGTGTNLNTIDFAKDLLFSMLTFSGGGWGSGRESRSNRGKASNFRCSFNGWSGSEEGIYPRKT